MDCDYIPCTKFGCLFFPDEFITLKSGTVPQLQAVFDLPTLGGSPAMVDWVLSVSALLPVEF